MKNLKKYMLLLWVLLLAGCGANEPAEELSSNKTEITSPAKTDEANPVEPDSTSLTSAPQQGETETITPGTAEDKEQKTVTLANLPAYSGQVYTILNDNKPVFNSMTTESYEFYSELDELGRCGVTEACIGRDIMPTEPRGEIGHIKPTGWQTAKYDKSVIKDMYLYNRCHLIGFQLTGENDNVRNLITGTRYMNMDGMAPFENDTAAYIKETGNHVMYRVTPVFSGDNLVADGVQMEAMSVEDNGAGICFNVFIYNVQPGITIDYATGNNALATAVVTTAPKPTERPNTPGLGEVKEYVLNTSTKKFHEPSCNSAKKIIDANRQDYTGTREELLEKGYDACKQCNP